jgi:hypothetical protein
MIEKDTVKLLRECDAGLKMGVSAIKDVSDFALSKNLKGYLKSSKAEHENLGREIESLLRHYGDSGKNPNPFVKGMSHMKTDIKLTVKESDNTAADLITDGCNMGVKYLNRYLNKYKAADEVSKDIAKRLIKLEDELAYEMRTFL